MRPLRLEIEGFSSYRKRETLDLAEVEFFSISGPTGSGKSSLVDAMIFALYGRVPRLGGNAVAPAITAGSDRARVRFDFEVGGVEHTAVRLAERTKTGATVREARLQRGEEILASGADDVSREVASLLQLGFDEFTRTVVLPQGEFARFLTAKKSERQELLRSLLALDVYGEMRTLARGGATVAEERARHTEGRLRSLQVPDEEAIAEAGRRLASLEQLKVTVVGDEDRLRADMGRLESSSRELEQIGDALKRLGAVEPPQRLNELDELALSAREDLEAATAALVEAVAFEESAARRVEELPSPEALNAAKRDLKEIAGIEERLESLDRNGCQEALAAAEARLAEHASALAEAEAALGEGRMFHAAHALASTLSEGQLCPVCEQEVLGLPENREPAELARLEADTERSRALVAEATSALPAARARVTELETRAAELETQLVRLRSGHPETSLEDVEGMIAEVEEARTSLASAVVTRKEREESLAGRRRVLEDLSERVRSLSRMLLAARQAVADLDPPIPESEDVLVQWKELLTWVDEALETLQERRATASRALEGLKTAVDEARRRLVVRMEAASVPAVEPFAVQVATQTELARQTVDRHKEVLAESAELEAHLAKHRSEAAVASELAGHLGAAGFERWLMAGAISDLVAGANDLLDQLSKGKYSLEADDDGAFSIVDHTKAGEIRPVSTLSGGETFLFSLALAMSLAETLSVAGGARLDAIILDEGFGTLDDEPLDVVASVLEELAAEDLMVGVITHVKELAGRAPARYEVIADPAGSKVVRVS